MVSFPFRPIGPRVWADTAWPPTVLVEGTQAFKNAQAMGMVPDLKDGLTAEDREALGKWLGMKPGDGGATYARQ